jgi:hypothetical protein
VGCWRPTWRQRQHRLSDCDLCGGVLSRRQDERTARPDVETYRAVLPSLMTLPGAMLVGISTPHKKSGLLFERYNERRRHGVWVYRNLDVEAFFDPEVWRPA